MAFPNQKLDEIRAAMTSTNRLFETEVFGKRNYSALEKIYTADARILPPGAPMIAGRAAIQEFWAGAIQSLNATRAVLTTIDVMPTGDGVVEIGSAILTIDPQGSGPVNVEAKYVVYWRQEDGLWKWHVDIWNNNA